jgi:hypothetical protein
VKVSELIAELQKHPAAAEVMLRFEYDDVHLISGYTYDAITTKSSTKIDVDTERGLISGARVVLQPKPNTLE